MILPRSTVCDTSASISTVSPAFGWYKTDDLQDHGKHDGGNNTRINKPRKIREDLFDVVKQNWDLLKEERNKDPCLFNSVPDRHKEINDSLHLSHPK